MPLPSVDELLTTAQERTGLDDYGPPTYREGLDRLVATPKRHGTERLVTNCLTRRELGRGPDRHVPGGPELLEPLGVQGQRLVGRPSRYGR